MLTYNCKHSTCKAEEELKGNLGYTMRQRHTSHTHAPPANTAGDKAQP